MAQGGAGGNHLPGTYDHPRFIQVHVWVTFSKQWRQPRGGGRRLMIEDPGFRQNKSADTRSRAHRSLIGPLAQDLDRLAHVGSCKCRLQRRGHLESRRRHNDTIWDTAMLCGSHRNGQTLRGLHDLSCPDDGPVKSLCLEAGNPGELIRCLKCIKESESPVSNTPSSASTLIFMANMI